MKKPRCGKKLRAYRLNRARSYDHGEAPVCGRAEGHESYAACKSEEVMRLEAARKSEKEKRMRRK